MYQAIVFVSLCTGAALLASEPARTVTFGKSWTGQTLPAFDKGYLLFTQHPNGVEVWGPDGQLVFRTNLTNPMASAASIAIDTDGTVAVGVGHSQGPHGKGGGFVVLDRSGRQIRFVDTGTYLPAHVAFDANHALWTCGWERDPATDTESKQEYSIIRKYSLAGKELGAYVPRSLFPRPGLAPGGAVGGLWRLRVAGDRVGAMVYSGMTGATTEWVELKLDGTLLGHWPVGRDAHGGYAFVSGIGLCRKDKSGVECFDRGAAAWKALSGVPVTDEAGATLGILLGADGDSLVFGKGDGNVRLSWIPATR